MCKSRAEGGQRCAGHTRARFERALAAGNHRRIEAAAAHYASTPEGRTRVHTHAEQCWADGRHETAAILTAAVHHGDTIRQVNTETTRRVAIATEITANRMFAVRASLDAHDTSDPDTARYVREVDRAITQAAAGTATIEQVRLIQGVPTAPDRPASAHPFERIFAGA